MAALTTTYYGCSYHQGFDGLDAFLGHTWAVTVTGAPKPWAIKFVEEHEETPRCWYGGAVGMLGFDGNVNTGLTLRTVRVHKGAAEVRAPAPAPAPTLAPALTPSPLTTHLSPSPSPSP